MATNPDYSMSDLGAEFSIGESAAYIIVLGDHVSGTVQKAFVEYLFGESYAPQTIPRAHFLAAEDADSWHQRERAIADGLGLV
jgi:hypothetical protein